MLLEKPTFEEECRSNAEKMAASREIQELTLAWICETARYKYTYNFTWMGRPIIQLPSDIVALQEIVWMVKPELVIETGIARGGSLIFYASLLELIGGRGQVLGIDVDIRDHNRVEIEQHPMFPRITMIEGSSTDEDVVARVYEHSRGRSPVLLVLDSSHTHEHVLRELELYSPLVTKGSYVVVLDTIVEDMPEHLFADRPWGKGNNPKTAVRQFLRTNDRFEIDRAVRDKLLISSSPDGYLRCVRE